MNYIQEIIKKQQENYHNKYYINFRKEAIKGKLTKAQFEEKFKYLYDNNYEQVQHTTIRKEMPAGTFSLTSNDYYFYLTLYDGKNYYWYTCNYRDDNKNVKSGSPFSKFSKLFKAKTNMTLKAAFGASKQEFKTLVPSPLYYINEMMPKYTWINHVSKEDFSSHYPSVAIYDLPDANTAITVKGYQKPNEEYKFAFYPDSGHIEIFGEFNTRDYMLPLKLFTAKAIRKEYITHYDLNIKKESKTILMKASKYTLKEEIEYFYSIKNNSIKDSEEYKQAKLFLLKFIGMMEQCSAKLYGSYPFAHLAAVIKWRANIKMFNYLEKIGYENIIQICVDGIIHTGKTIGVDEKKLGNLVKEVVDAKFIQRGINQYIIKNKETEERRFAGFDVDTDKNIEDWKASSKVNFKKYILNKDWSK